MKRFDLRVAQMHYAALRSQVSHKNYVKYTAAKFQTIVIINQTI